MKVRLNVPICGPEGSFIAGDEPELSENLANALITAGQAVKIGGVCQPIEKQLETKDETDIVEPVTEEEKEPEPKPAPKKPLKKKR